MTGKTKKLTQAVNMFFQRNQRFFAIPLVYIAILLILAFYLLGLTNHNLLIIPTLLIPVGIYGYVRQEKHNSRY